MADSYKVTCRTERTDCTDVDWPTSFACVPRAGDFVEGQRRRGPEFALYAPPPASLPVRLYVSMVVHKRSGEGQPMIELVLV